MRRLCLLGLLVLTACASKPAPPVPDAEQYLPPDIEAMSLLGKPLHVPELPADERKKREEELAKAQHAYDLKPDSADAALAAGDRLADLGRYREAIAVFTEAIHRHPDDVRLFRDRGHRLINVRRFSDGLNDLQTAELLEHTKPDANEEQQIHYLTGLANYLSGDFDKALAAYRRSLALSKTPDRLVATSDWIWMTLRRLGRSQEAEKVLEPISIDINVADSVAHHQLLLMYEGEIAPEELLRQNANTADGVTILYGVGNWYYVNGQPERAAPVWKKILDGNQSFNFAYVAAEAEMARLDKGRRSP
jgi:tetratricopeptide (TPR) repeat protein